jgi:hypothetical protein
MTSYATHTIACAVCDARRTVARPNARYCSDACRMRRARERPDLARCPVCRIRRPLGDFAAGRAGQPAGPCRECRKALARLRRAARARELVICECCRVAKPAAAFYPNPATKRGRSKKCRPCTLAIARMRRAARAGSAAPEQALKAALAAV